MTVYANGVVVFTQGKHTTNKPNKTVYTKHTLFSTVL